MKKTIGLLELLCLVILAALSTLIFIENRKSSQPSLSLELSEGVARFERLSDSGGILFVGENTELDLFWFYGSNGDVWQDEALKTMTRRLKHGVYPYHLVCGLAREYVSLAIGDDVTRIDLKSRTSGASHSAHNCRKGKASLFIQVIDSGSTPISLICVARLRNNEENDVQAIKHARESVKGRFPKIHE